MCGALVAYKLARKGHKVLVLEAGPDKTDRIAYAGSFATAVDKHPGSPYRHAGPGYIVGPDNDKTYYQQTTKDLFKSTFVRITGGSTWHFLGNVPRFVPSDFRLKDKYEVADNWPIGYDDLEPFYCEAECEMGVSGDHQEWNGYLGAHRSRSYPMNKIWQAYGDQLFLDKVDNAVVDGRKVKILSTPQARNSTIYDGRPACAGNSTCVPICPIQAKYDATVHVQKAKAHGAVVYANSVVKKLFTDESNRITRLTYHDLATGQDKEIETREKTVVLAAHAIETPRLLLYSGLARQSGQVGKNLMDHLQGYCVALSPHPVYPFRGPLTTSGIDVFRDGESRKKFAAFRMSIGNDGWGRIESPVTTLWENLNQGIFGKTLHDNLRERVTRMIRISFSTEMLPQEKNAVTLSDATDPLGIPRPRLSFHFDDYNRLAMEYAYGISQQLFALAGCIVDDTKGQVKDYSGAGHIMGTTRMGTDAGNSVVDHYGKVHEHPNLYIAGPSTFVTSGTANPTLTAAALSLRTARRLDKVLSNRIQHP
ncbi:MAG: GMC family oxidoreductase [Cytophagales bacterium]|nr:GMC family oxidoreductase [Cytophagales bacterium]